MPVRRLNPYIIFNGTAEKAIRLYERTLGARAEGLTRYGDAPGGMVPAAARDRVMHAELHVGDGLVMVSDAPPDRPSPAEGNVHIALDFADLAEMARRFNALADGGTVTMPLQDTFWGARFGMLTDAFGVSWMFNCSTKQA